MTNSSTLNAFASCFFYPNKGAHKVRTEGFLHNELVFYVHIFFTISTPRLEYASNHYNLIVYRSLVVHKETMFFIFFIMQISNVLKSVHCKFAINWLPLVLTVEYNFLQCKSLKNENCKG